MPAQSSGRRGGLRAQDTMVDARDPDIDAHMLALSTNNHQTDANCRLKSQTQRYIVPYVQRVSQRDISTRRKHGSCPSHNTHHLTPHVIMTQAAPHAAKRPTVRHQSQHTSGHPTSHRPAGTVGARMPPGSRTGRRQVPGPGCRQQGPHTPTWVVTGRGRRSRAQTPRCSPTPHR